MLLPCISSENLISTEFILLKQIWNDQNKSEVNLRLQCQIQGQHCKANGSQEVQMASRWYNCLPEGLGILLKTYAILAGRWQLCWLVTNFRRRQRRLDQFEGLLVNFNDMNLISNFSLYSPHHQETQCVNMNMNMNKSTRLLLWSPSLDQSPIVFKKDSCQSFCQVISLLFCWFAEDNFQPSIWISGVAMNMRPEPMILQIVVLGIVG